MGTLHALSLISSHAEGKELFLWQSVPEEVYDAAFNLDFYLPNSYFPLGVSLAKTVERFLARSLLDWLSIMIFIGKTSLVLPCLKRIQFWAVRLTFYCNTYQNNLNYLISYLLGYIQVLLSFWVMHHGSYLPTSKNCQTYFMLLSNGI